MTQRLPVVTTTSLSDQVRVLIISDAAPHRNGVGAYYADLMRDLRPFVGAIDMLSPEVIDKKWQGGWMLPLPGDNTQKVCLPNAFELKKKIKAFQPTVIVIPTPGLFGLVGAMLARASRIPIVIGFHTWFEKLAGLYWNRLQGGLTKTYFEASHKALFRLADKTLANSREMVTIADAVGAPCTSLMGTPLSENILAKPVAAIPKRINRVLFIGRLAAEKNITAILTAAADFPDLMFTIAGDGPLKTSIEAQAESLPNVQLLGWVGRDSVVDLIDEHDLLVLPSHVESFGTVALEAMARQRPVIVSAACGITQWVGLEDALLVMQHHQTLSDVLAPLLVSSEFELYRRCAKVRAKALEHVHWNRDLWLSQLQALQARELPMRAGSDD